MTLLAAHSRRPPLGFQGGGGGGRQRVYCEGAAAPKMAQKGKSVQHGWHRQDGVNSSNGMVLVFPNEFLKNSYGELLLILSS
jgi:hypothetical protein